MSKKVSLLWSDIEAYASISSYPKFKKAIRALRDRGYTITPTRNQAYYVADDAGTGKLITWRPPVKGSLNLVEAPEIVPAAVKNPKSRNKAKEPKASVPKLVSRAVALKMLEEEELSPLVVDPSETFVSFAWDLRELMTAGTTRLSETMFDVFKGMHPTVTREDVRYLLYSHSPNGTEFPQPMVAIDFIDHDAYIRATPEVAPILEEVVA